MLEATGFLEYLPINSCNQTVKEGKTVIKVIITFVLQRTLGAEYGKSKPKIIKKHIDLDIISFLKLSLLRVTFLIEEYTSIL